MLEDKIFAYTQNNPVMYSDISGYRKCLESAADKISETSCMGGESASSGWGPSNGSEDDSDSTFFKDIMRIFHNNSSALVYRKGLGLGGMIHRTGFYYTEFSDGYYIDDTGVYEVVDGQIIDALLVSSTIITLEDGRIVGGAGLQFGPISVENYGPDISNTSVFLTLGLEGGVIYTAGEFYSVDVIGFGKDIWEYLFGDD